MIILRMRSDETKIIKCAYACQQPETRTLLSKESLLYFNRQFTVRQSYHGKTRAISVFFSLMLKVYEEEEG